MPPAHRSAAVHREVHGADPRGRRRTPAGTDLAPDPITESRLTRYRFPADETVRGLCMRTPSVTRIRSRSLPSRVGA